MRRPSVIFQAVLLSLTPFTVSMAQTIPCTDVLLLVDESKTGFLAAKKESEFGGYETATQLPGAHHCVIIEDVEKRSHSCTWEYAYGDALAEAEFEQFAAEVLDCLGSSAMVIDDQPVNHPDTYKAHIYRFSDTEVRVTLKDKSALNSTYVSVIIEGRHVQR